jgi:hypothetical protein
MKRIFTQLSVIAFLLSSFSFHCLGADKYTLQFNLDKGKIYKQRVITDVNMVMNAMGQDIKMNMKMEMMCHYDVIEKNNTGYDIRMSFQKIKMDMNFPSPFTIDSDSPENSFDKSIGDFFKSLVGVPVDFQITKQGKVTSVKGADKLEEKINTLSNEQFKQQFRQQFSEKAIQTTIEQTSAYFPNNPVALNESWDIVNTLASTGFDIINKMNLTLKQVKDNVATLEIKGTLVTPEGGSVLKIQGMDAKVSMKGEQAGTVLMDMKTGWIIRSEITQKSAQDLDIMGQIMKQQTEVIATVTAD